MAPLLFGACAGLGPSVWSTVVYQVLKFVKRFTQDQNGSAQVEHIVLAAGLVGICLSMTQTISAGMLTQSDTIIDAMQIPVVSAPAIAD